MALLGRLKGSGVNRTSPERSDLAPWFVARSNDHSAGQVLESATALGLVDLAGSLAQIAPSEGDAFLVSLEFVDERGAVVTSETWDARFIEAIRLSVEYGDRNLVVTLNRDGEAAVMAPAMKTLDLIPDRRAEDAIADIPDVLRQLPLTAQHHAALESLPEPMELTVRGTDLRAIPAGGLSPRTPGF